MTLFIFLFLLLLKCVSFASSEETEQFPLKASDMIQNKQSKKVKSPNSSHLTALWKMQ